MTGNTNVYDYITTEGKITGKKSGRITALEYLQKSTGVFNGNGLLSEEKVAEMKERLKNNKGNIWHGFISLNEEQSHKIDTPEKCIGLIKRTFGEFLTDRFKPACIFRQPIRISSFGRKSRRISRRKTERSITEEKAKSRWKPSTIYSSEQDFT